MSVIGLGQELPDSPSGQSNVGKDSSSSFTRKFLVQVSSIYDGPITVMYAAGVPADWSYYWFGSEYHLFARLKSKDAKRRGQYWWEVTCNYETADEDEEDPDDPTSEQVKLSIDWETGQELVTGMYTSSASPVDGLRNSAGELFKQPATREVDNIVINISRNENIATDIGTIASTFNNAINSNVWGGFAAHTLRLRLRAEREFREVGESKTQVPYLKVSYSIKHRSQTWDLVLLDHGSFYFDDGDKINFKTESGENYLGLLDLSGGESETAKFLEAKQIYQEADFSTLHLPTNFMEV